MRILAIVQARLGSTRLPSKVLLEVKGKPLIVHMLDRLKQCKLINHIVLATSDRKRDQVLLDLAEKQEVEGFAGSETDVLERYYQVALQHEPESVVRCTGDCPLIDPHVTDRVIRCHLEKKKDYTSNTVERSYPRGLDTEIMTFSALARAAREAKQPYEREHVTPYIFQHPELFSIEQVAAEPELYYPALRLTVDTAEDFTFIREIFNHLYESNPLFLTVDILNLLKEYPGLAAINAKVEQKTV